MKLLSNQCATGNDHCCPTVVHHTSQAFPLKESLESEEEIQYQTSAEQCIRQSLILASDIVLQALNLSLRKQNQNLSDCHYPRYRVSIVNKVVRAEMPA